MGTPSVCVPIPGYAEWVCVCGRLFIQLDHAKTPLQQPSFVFFLEPKNKLEISFSQMLFQTSTLDVESKAAAVS